MAVVALMLGGCSTTVQGTPTASENQTGDLSIDDAYYVGSLAEMCTWLLDFLEQAEAIEGESFDRARQIRDLYDWMVEGEDWKSISKEDRERTIHAFDLAESGRC